MKEILKLFSGSSTVNETTLVKQVERVCNARSKLPLLLLMTVSNNSIVRRVDEGDVVKLQEVVRNRGSIAIKDLPSELALLSS